MIEALTYTFPATRNNFFEDLKALCKDAIGVTTASDLLTITPSYPKAALPMTIFKLDARVMYPQINIGETPELALRVGRLGINSSSIITELPKPLPKTRKQDTLGPYYEIHAPGIELYRLPMAEISKRLAGHVVRIDHTGINIPSALITRKTWEQYIYKLARACALYRYPSGEDWPFMLPVSKDEFTQDIHTFMPGREPKFELVYDTLSPVPTIQLDIGTDLTRAEIETLTPAPYGVSFPDLADYFRTVYLDHDWLGLNIKLDIRFKDRNPMNAWNTGEWLVKDGGRIRVSS